MAPVFLGVQIAVLAIILRAVQRIGGAVSNSEAIKLLKIATS